jgi:hypothetical protein
MPEEAQEQQQSTINDIQRLHFELLRHTRYNLLDGERVVRDLLQWRDLWYSVLPTRFPYISLEEDDTLQYHPYTELSLLRTTRWDYFPIDTLYIWTTDSALPHLRQFIEAHWQPDEIEVLSPNTDKEMHLMHIDGEHDRVLFV